MSTCTSLVGGLVIDCKNAMTKVDYECSSWADEGSNQCAKWADEGSNQCGKWADEGSNQCGKWADEGSSQCIDWSRCHWYEPWNCVAGLFCRAYYWAAKWVCKAYYWAAKWVCKAYYWAAKWVCKAFAWITKAVCVVTSWAADLTCLAIDGLRCSWLRTLRPIVVSIFDGRQSKPAIKHVFVLMLENRSYDHVLGFGDFAGRDPDGNPTVADGANPTRDSNLDPSTGGAIPVSLGADFTLKGLDLDPGHEFLNTVTSLCGSASNYDPNSGIYPAIDNSGFVANYMDTGSPSPQRIMRSFSPEQLPVLHALAREYALCDRWFSSMPGPTWPNRFFTLAGTSGGLDDSPPDLDAGVGSTLEGYRFANGTIFDRLDDNCLDWMIYEGDLFPVSFAMHGMTINAARHKFRSIDSFAADLTRSDYGPRFTFIEPRYGAHTFNVGPGDFTCGDSMHPLDDVTRGEDLIKYVYESIRNSPIWNESALIVTFDEHGGFYDHVIPPAAVPPGDKQTADYVQHNFRFDQLGVRVPAIVISPLIPRGTIDHNVYDHTSILATLERLLGLAALTKRDASSNNLLHLFSLQEPRTDTPSRLPNAAANPNPLNCGDDVPTENKLLERRSTLLEMQVNPRKFQELAEAKINHAQRGFILVALRRVMATAHYPETESWTDQYLSISTPLDAALFVTEAQLLLYYEVDFKRPRNKSVASKEKLGSG